MTMTVRGNWISGRTENIFTLDNIFKYASEEELSAIVHSIFGRLCDYERRSMGNVSSNGFTDMEFNEVVKGLRKAQ